jgi:hypothetical protein
MINFFRLVLAGMALAMAGLISAVTTMHFAIHGAEVKVPDLQGLTVAEAVHRTANMGLNLGIDNKYYSADVPAGRVLAQSPLRPSKCAAWGWISKRRRRCPTAAFSQER